MRLLILIHAYNAQKTIAKILSDIPPDYKNNPDITLLLIDDASTDATVRVAQDYQKNSDFKNLHVLRNRQNQGYGGNQKIGYRYAIQNNFDAVVLLHADGHFTPRIIPHLAKPLLDNPASACALGVHSGLQGLLTLYTTLGNVLLTTIQNYLSNQHLSQWHTGCRIYRVEALKKIAFELNTNSFHFDTEILLQLLNQKLPIDEVKISKELAHQMRPLHALRHGKNILKATLKFRLQRYNLFYDIRYHPNRISALVHGHSDLKHYSHKLGSNSPHSLVSTSSKIVQSKTSILDIGCADGSVAERLIATKDCHVVGIDLLPDTYVRASQFEYHCINLETELDRLNQLLEKRRFDTVLMLDVIEHLSNPETFLLNLYRRRYMKTPKFIFSTGNVAFIVVRFMLLLGFFNYGDKGILDITHRRLFSNRTFKNALEQTGFIISKKHYFPFPFQALGFHSSLARPLERINQLLIYLWPSLFAYQIMVEAIPLTPPDFTLADTLTTETELYP